MLRVLNDHEVQYVVVGGIATILHGDLTQTVDLDLTPEPSEANLTRLAKALGEMGAGLRVPDLDDPVAVRWHPATFRSMTTATTRGPLGDLDVVLRPDGVPGAYEQLAAAATEREAFGLTIQIASLDDLIATKRAAAQLTGLPKYEESVARLLRLEEAVGTAPPRPPQPE